MQNKRKNFRLVLDPAKLTPAKNVDGHLGEKCNNCGGFGYTLSIKGSDLSCSFCESTGVKLASNRELQAQITELQLDLTQLKQIIIKRLGKAEISTIPTKQETNV